MIVYHGAGNEIREPDVAYSKRNDQICIAKQKIIESHLKFLESYEVVNDYE